MLSKTRDEWRLDYTAALALSRESLKALRLRLMEMEALGSAMGSPGEILSYVVFRRRVESWTEQLRQEMLDRDVPDPEGPRCA